MSIEKKLLILNNIKLPIDASWEEAFSVAERRLSKAIRLKEKPIYRIYRKSVDARKKNDIKFVYSVAVEGDFDNISHQALSLIDASFDKSTELMFDYGVEEMDGRPLIVGTGPAGLFAGLVLAENGYAPILLERGGSIKERIASVKKFKSTRILDTDCNIQFGAGGAGTFSDGKLITRINDSLTSYVLKRLVEFGAPKDILYLAKPHIGTDILSNVVDRILERIKQLGGEILYRTTYLDSDFSNKKVTFAKTSNGNIKLGALILAIGHSARDTYETLINNNLSIEAKNFSVGMRVEHLTENIDRAMYGDFAGSEALGHAEYGLSWNTKVRGVYTFCMCPGGEVVPATSEQLGVVVNGMSNHSRSGRNSNSAVVCSVFKEDFGGSAQSAIEFQRNIERKAFLAGGGDYSAPFITVGDFLNNKLGSMPKSVVPSYMDGAVRNANPYDYLPGFVCDNLKNALLNFDKKINGFAHDEAVLTGAETRTSAPIRILRDNTTYLALGYDNVYPVGEGAGYAGGITSASIDGLRIALSLMERYKPLKLG